MIKIMICDSFEESEIYSDWILEAVKKQWLDVKLVTVRSTEEFEQMLFSSADVADIIYMDWLEATPVNGMDMARRLREMGGHAEIIFLTDAREAVFDSFDVTPLHYLLKETVTQEKFEAVFFKAVDKVGSMDKKYIVCETGKGRNLILIQDISYMEIMKRIVIIHFADGRTFEFYTTLERMSRQLADKQFLRTHRSYLVNIKYIVKCKTHSVALTTGESIPIGTTYADYVKNTLYNLSLKC